MLLRNSRYIILNILFLTGPVRLSVRTPAFQAGKRGSTPLRATRNKIKQSALFYFLIVYRRVEPRKGVGETVVSPFRVT